MNATHFRLIIAYYGNKGLPKRTVFEDSILIQTLLIQKYEMYF